MDHEVWRLIWNFNGGWPRGYPKEGVFPKSILEELQLEHLESNKKLIPELNNSALRELVNTLKKSKICTESAELVAEHIVCEYIKNVDAQRTNPRISKFYSEIKDIRESAIDFERSLRKLSEQSIDKLRYFLGSEYEGSPSEPPWQTYNEIFTCDEYGDDDFILRVNPKMLFMLVDLARAAKDFISELPEDSGGPISGIHDSTGARARTHLTLISRVLLRYLGLPSGSQKSGPISIFLSLIQKSATGETPSWTDRYAAMAPKLEKKWLEQDAKHKAYLEKPLAECLMETSIDKLLLRHAEQRLARIEAYRQEIGGRHDTP